MEYAAGQQMAIIAASVFAMTGLFFYILGLNLINDAREYRDGQTIRGGNVKKIDRLQFSVKIQVGFQRFVAGSLFLLATTIILDAAAQKLFYVPFACLPLAVSIAVLEIEKWYAKKLEKELDIK